jgi:cytochrome P450
VLAWTFYLLALHPGIEARLRAHVLEVLGDRDPTVEDVPRLTYVTQVVQEAMRLYPPAWVMERETLADDELGGYRVPAGSTVAVSPYVLHRHPEHWPDPEPFDPDRFAPEHVRARSRYAYLPFGAGPRLCIGNAFALMELAVIVAMVVRERRLELEPGYRLELEPLTTLRPKHLPMRARRVPPPTPGGA